MLGADSKAPKENNANLKNLTENKKVPKTFSSRCFIKMID